MNNDEQFPKQIQQIIFVFFEKNGQTGRQIPFKDIYSKLSLIISKPEKKKKKISIYLIMKGIILNMYKLYCIETYEMC